MLNQEGPLQFYGTLAVPSLLLSGFVCYTYMRHARFRKHPNSLVVSRAVCNILMNLTMLVYIFHFSSKSQTCDTSGHFCQNAGSVVIAFYTASQAYFIGVCSDLFITLTRPLRSPKSVLIQVRLSVVLLSAAVGGLSVFLPNFKCSRNMCNLKKDLTAWEGLVLLLPLFCSMIVGIGSAYFSISNLRAGLSESLQLRKRVVTDHTISVVTYVVMSVVAIIIVIARGVLRNHSKSVAIILFSQSLSDAVAWYLQKYYSGARCSFRSILCCCFENSLFSGGSGSLSSQGTLREFGSGVPMVSVDRGIPRPDEGTMREIEALLGKSGAHFSSEPSSNGHYPKASTFDVDDPGFPKLLNIRSLKSTDDNEIRGAMMETTQEIQEMEDDRLLSDALRKELIVYMTEGITTAVERASSVKDPSCEDFPAEEIHALHTTVQLGTKKSTSVFNSNRTSRVSSYPVPPGKSHQNYGPAASIDTVTGPKKFAPFAIDELPDSTVQKLNLRLDINPNRVVSFRDYAPQVFRYLRTSVYQINDVSFLDALSISDEDSAKVTAKSSEGASGAFFFSTPDSQYFIKTVTETEAHCFLRILPGYFEHMRHHPTSLIVRFCGLYSIKMYGSVLYFTVMKNIFVPGVKPHEMYDIKGSWVNRHTKHHIETGKLMKDEDLHKRMILHRGMSKSLFYMLKEDTRFLAQMNIMDYSLLLGIYNVGLDSEHLEKQIKQWRLEADTSHLHYRAPEYPGTSHAPMMGVTDTSASPVSIVDSGAVQMDAHGGILSGDDSGLESGLESHMAVAGSLSKHNTRPQLVGYQSHSRKLPSPSATSLRVGPLWSKPLARGASAQTMSSQTDPSRSSSLQSPGTRLAAPTSTDRGGSTTLTKSSTGLATQGSSRTMDLRSRDEAAQQAYEYHKLSGIREDGSGETSPGKMISDVEEEPERPEDDAELETIPDDFDDEDEDSLDDEDLLIGRGRDTVSEPARQSKLTASLIRANELASPSVRPASIKPLSKKRGMKRDRRKRPASDMAVIKQYHTMDKTDTGLRSASVISPDARKRQAQLQGSLPSHQGKRDVSFDGASLSGTLGVPINVDHHSSVIVHRNTPPSHRKAGKHGRYSHYSHRSSKGLLITPKDEDDTMISDTLIDCDDEDQLPDQDGEMMTLTSFFKSQSSIHEENANAFARDAQFRQRAFTSGTKLQEVQSYTNSFQSKVIEGPGYYCLGIIDILQEWNMEKKLEHFAKVYARCQDAKGVSCIEPKAYRKRFLAKMMQIGISPRKIDYS